MHQPPPSYGLPGRAVQPQCPWEVAPTEQIAGQAQLDFAVLDRHYPSDYHCTSVATARGWQRQLHRRISNGQHLVLDYLFLAYLS